MRFFSREYRCITYAARGTVSDLNLQRVGEAFDVAALATPQYESLVNSTFDVRALQEFRLANKHAIQLSVDVLNFGNLLNSNWGVRQFASYTGLAQPLGVNVATTTTGTTTTSVPTYSFDANQRTTFFNDSQLISRWRMQFGLRYSF